MAAYIAAAASLGAGLIHLAVLPSHWQEWLASGVFFAALAVFQLGWTVLMIMRPHRAVLLAGIVVNLAALAVWVPSRTAGLPFGPHAGEPEAVQAAGIAVVVLEAAIIAAAAWVWFRGHRADAVSDVSFRIVLAGTGAVVAAIVAIGMASGLDHAPHSPSGVGGHDDHDHPNPVVFAPDVETSHVPAPPQQPQVPKPDHEHNHGHGHG